MGKLGDYITIKHGFAFKGESITTNDNGVVLVTPGNFSIGGGFKENKCKFFEGEYPSEYVLAPNDLIVTMTDLSKDMDTLGYSALVPASKRVYLHNQRIGLINVNSNDLDKQYLYWFMRTKKYQRTVAGTASGTTVHHTSPSRIYDVDVFFPDIQTQKKISCLLNSIENRININNLINKNLEQQAQAIFKSWFLDFEPFGGVIPDDWRIGTISDLSSKIICGKTPSTKKKEYYGDYMPFITIPDMHNSVFVTSTERYLSKMGADSQSKKTLPANSICVSCIGTAGLVTLVAVDSQTNQQINSIIPKEDYLSYYIFLLMQTFSEKINRLGQSGSTIVNLNKSQFGIIEALVPTIATMKDFGNIVKPLFEQILANQYENQHLASLRDTLLPKLMNGEIDVSQVHI